MRIKSVPTHIIRLLNEKLKANKYYNWYVFSQRLSRQLKDTVMKSYCVSDVDANTSGIKEKKQVVFVCNGNIESGGWADRLKGIISTYQICKEEDYDFRLLFTSPFPLQNFLIPNTYDWQIATEDVIFERPHTDVVAFEIGEETAYQSQKQKQYLQSKLRTSKAKQIHVYCNAMFSYNADFAGMFGELFRPTPQLASSIERQTSLIGSEYISISVRFIGALGDFTDTMQIEPLPDKLQKQLIERCTAAIRTVHEKHPNSKILVNSDSTTFLDAARQLPYTYIIPGEILHLDIKPDSATDDYSLYEKTMLDFFMIARAKHIYRIDGRWIHPSGYPLAASKIYNHPFSTIQTN